MHRQPVNTRRWIARIVQAIFALLCWHAMMLAHEAGHIAAALLSGGRVQYLDMPLIGFSRTDLSFNPHPLIVVWGGFFGGCLLPLVAWAVARVLRRHWYAQFFAGFCLIANGGYIGAGWIIPAGDARDMLRLKTPGWVMAIAGAAAVSAGLYLLDRLQREVRTARGNRPSAGIARQHDSI